MDDLWSWFSTAVVILAYVVGVSMLIRHRRRSRQATTLALVALAALIADSIFGGMLMWAVLHWAYIPHQINYFEAVGAFERLVRMGALLILVWAVILDRPDVELMTRPPGRAEKGRVVGSG
jgi:hypothetical protein